MEYLKIAQDLEMYGVSYFSITVSVNYGALPCIFWYSLMVTVILVLYFCFTHHIDSKIRGTQTCYLEWMLRAFISTAPTAN